MSLRLELSASLPVLCLGCVLSVAAATVVLCSPLPAVARLPLLLAVGAGGLRGIALLLHGRSRAALQMLEWQGGDRWLLRRGDGRQAAVRLHPRSRRVGEAALLVFRRGGFSPVGRPWVLILPHMVNDPVALRRLRVRLTLQGEIMRGRAVS